MLSPCSSGFAVANLPESDTRSVSRWTQRYAHERNKNGRLFATLFNQKQYTGRLDLSIGSFSIVSSLD